MPATIHDVRPEDLGQTSVRSQFARDVLVGLSQTRKFLQSKYFYDDRGSELFTQITQAEEYYPFDAEREILTNQAAAIADWIGTRPFNLVELGAGDGQKTRHLLRELTARKLDFHFAPIDISRGAIEQLVTNLDPEFPDLAYDGIASEYFTGLRWLTENRPERFNVVLFLGSTIGNFETHTAQTFLCQLWAVLQPNDLALIGFDLKKDIQRMIAAYNDRDGVTRAFNLNLLERINRELGGNFDLDKWTHYEPYEPDHGAMMSYLISLEPQRVEIEACGRSFAFDAWEPIFTECSVKYTETEIRNLAHGAGFEVQHNLFDSRHDFCDSLWHRRKGE